MHGECLRGHPNLGFPPVDRGYGWIARAVVEYQWVVLGDGYGVFFWVVILSSLDHGVTIAMIQLIIRQVDWSVFV